MSAHHHNLFCALRNGEIIHIDSVESGLKCNCTCPACGEKLIARKGSIVVHHFAHQSGTMCEYGYQTSLHLAAKDILATAKTMMLPPVILSFPNSDKKVKIREGIRLNFDRVELERKQGEIIPDIVVYCGNRKLYIEIFVTHKIDEIKLKKIKEQDISTIEIDLSNTDREVTKKDLEQILYNENLNKKWIHNSLCEKWLNRFLAVSEKKYTLYRGFAIHVDYCPIKKRSYKGKPYANVIDDCLCCEYCIAFIQTNEDEEEYILCSGKRRIAEIADFSSNETERIKIADKKQEAVKMDMISKGFCPNCEGKLVPRRSKFGEFLGCSNYPHCRFTFSLNSETGEIQIKS